MIINFVVNAIFFLLFLVSWWYVYFVSGNQEVLKKNQVVLTMGRSKSIKINFSFTCHGRRKECKYMEIPLYDSKSLQSFVHLSEKGTHATNNIRRCKTKYPRSITWSLVEYLRASPMIDLYIKLILSFVSLFSSFIYLLNFDINIYLYFTC